MPAHLFLIANASGFGEINVGLGLARALAARGERVEFLAPRDAAVMLGTTPFRHRPVDEAYWDLGRRLPALLREERFDSLVLVDVTSVLLALQSLCADTGFLERLPVPVVALDFWDLRRAGAEWDLGSETWPLPPEAARMTRRLVPAPLAAPDTAGAFDALPKVAEDLDARGRERAALGLDEDARVVLFTSSRFQQADVQVRKPGQRLARLMPGLLWRRLDALGPSVHVLHVGPAAFDDWQRRGPRYHWVGQVDTSRFHALLRAADLMLSFNTTGTTTMAAVAAGLPVAAGMNSRRLRTADEAPSVLGREPSPALASWLAEVAPLYPFHVWGLGLYEFLQPVLRGNPYLECVRLLEILDEERFVDECRALLFDERARGGMREAQADYVRAVRRLPSSAQAFDQALSST
jgi:Family of unknown function (DUF6365)